MEDILSNDFASQLTATGEVDVLVCIPTANNSSTIAHAVNAIQIGLAKYFPRERAALMNVDADSRDGTQEIIRSAAIRDFQPFLAPSPLRTSLTLTASYHPNRGQAAALWLTMTAVDLLRAKACAIVSPDVSSLTPEWIEALLRPVYREGFDLVTPLYQRHRFEGLLVRNILTPVVRAAYGYQIEEPAPDEVGVSRALAAHLLDQEVWKEKSTRAGAFVWLTTAALTGDFRVAQAFLGPKVQAARQSGSSLPEAIQQVVGALFNSLEAHEAFWRDRSNSQPVPLFGFPVEMDIGTLRVNRKKMSEMFRSGTSEISSILSEILVPATLNEVLEVAKADEDNCCLPDELWARVVYEFAAAFHHRVMNRDHLLQALTPIYRGRVSSYLRENRGATLDELRQRREALQLEFERMKPYLVEQWSAKR